MLVITTPTGQIGRDLVALLLDRDQALRVVVRDPERLDPAVRERVEVVEGSHRDAETMDRALDGADALFLVVPPGFDDSDTRSRYLAFARASAAAIRAHGVPHVVGVSSAGHGWSGDAGLLSDAFAMDREIVATGASYRALSMPWYMENLLTQLDGIRNGTLAMGYDENVVLPSVATQDIAAEAAGLLLDRSWHGYQDAPVIGPDRLTAPQMAAIIGDTLGSTVDYQRLDLDTVAGFITGHGATPETAAGVTNMIAAQNAGIYADDLADTSATPAPTAFRDWCRTTLAPAFRG